MLKIKSVLNPELVKLLADKYPVVRKRTPLWFFTDELNSGAEKPKRNQIWDQWKKMNPESKRKYFNMAKLDEVRYKEQRSLWIAEIGSLLAKYGDKKSKLSDYFSIDATQYEVPDIDRYQKNRECMIQTESTRMIFKDEIERMKRSKGNMATKQLISDVPEDYRPILSSPRRPATSFILYMRDHKDILLRLQKEKYPRMPFMKVVQNQWAILCHEKRKAIKDEYDKSMEEYRLAKQQFEKESEDEFLKQASREKKVSNRGLRRRLRKFDLVPLNVRNAFNFFRMDTGNKGMPLRDLAVIWRNLPEEKKEIYKHMTRQDAVRYYHEKSPFEEIEKNLQQISKKDSKVL